MNTTERTLKQKLLADSISVPDEKIRILDRFTDLLLQWRQVHNLTGARTREEIYDHIVDAVYPYSFLAPVARFLDVGTGAGFPGLVLAVVWDQSEAVLCEPIKKRSAFLRYVVAALELKKVCVEARRVETLRCEPFDLITSRAVSDTALLLELTSHLSTPKTAYLFYKGQRVYEEAKKISPQREYDILEYGKRKYLYIKGARG